MQPRKLNITGGFTLISEQDFEKVSSLNWHVNSNGYARSNNHYNGQAHKIYMHQIILGKKIGFDIDHINGNKLDNRQENLRHISRTSNNHNTKKTTAMSGYRGVYKSKSATKPWYARIKHQGVYHRSAPLETLEQAVEARKELERLWVEPSVGRKKDADFAQAVAFGWSKDQYMMAEEA